MVHRRKWIDAVSHNMQWGAREYYKSLCAQRPSEKNRYQLSIASGGCTCGLWSLGKGVPTDEARYVNFVVMYVLVLPLEFLVRCLSVLSRISSYSHQVLTGKSTDSLLLFTLLFWYFLILNLERTGGLAAKVDRVNFEKIWIPFYK